MFATLELECLVHGTAFRLPGYSFEIYDNCDSAFVLELTNDESGRKIQVGYVHHDLCSCLLLDSSKIYPGKRGGLIPFCLDHELDGCDIPTTFDSCVFFPYGFGQEDAEICKYIFDVLYRFHGLRLI